MPRSPAPARRSTASRPRHRSGRRSSRVEKDAGSTAASPDLNARLRELPSVEELAAALGSGIPHALAVRAARAAIGAARERIVAGEDAGDLVAEARAALEADARPRLRGVVNATGVIVHTNLGRAPLADAARDAVAAAATG